MFFQPTDQAPSPRRLKEVVEIFERHSAETRKSNIELADAIDYSSAFIDELEETKRELAQARDQVRQSALHTLLLSETIFERTHDAVIVLREDGTCVSVNQNASRMFRLSTELADQFKAWEQLTAFRAPDGLPWIDRVRLNLSKSEIITLELFQTVDGCEQWVQFSFSQFSIRDEPHVLLAASDITSRKEFENKLLRSRDFLGNTLNAIPDLLCVKSADLKPVLVNDSFLEFHQLSATKNLADQVAIASNEKIEEHELELFANSHDSESEESHIDGEGKAQTFSTRRSVFSDPLTGEKFLVAASRNITQQKEIEDRNRLLASVFENSQDAVVILNLDGSICEANPKFCQTCGLSNVVLLNSVLTDIVSWEYFELEQLIEAAIIDIPLPGRVQINSKTDVQTPGSSDRKAVYWGSLSTARNENGEATNLIAMFSDITQIEETQRRLHQQALHDNLTGLPNRRYFSEHIEERTGESPDRFAVCFLDLDDFKIVNDTLGHAAGDQLLVAVSGRIKSCLPRDCFLARFGGDEFALLIPENDESTRIDRIANEVVNALNRPFMIGENRVYIGVSIGLTLCPDDATDVHQLLRNADVAMYHAKDAGKNTVRGYTPVLAAKIEASQTLLDDLRRAVINQELMLYYQPKICLKTGALCGCEALVRWIRRGLPVSPADFIDVAEKSGLIIPLGDQILEMAMRQTKIWRESGVFSGSVAINLSPRQLADPHFIKRFRELLESTETKAEWFELEITENAMVDNLDVTRERMNQLNDIGVKFAIDDFGTGYSSLNYLKTFPVATLKIDLSFVRDLPHDLRAVAIAKTVLSLGHGLGLSVVAEGVETVEQRNFLRDAGCDIMQGYLINKPLPVPEFTAWATERKLSTPQPGSSCSPSNS